MDTDRQDARHHLLHNLIVFEDSKIVGFIMDISESGMRMISDQVFSEGAEHNLRIYMPNSIGKTREVEIKARCVWNKSAEDEKYYIAGFNITSGDEEAINDIRKVIDNMGKD